MWQLLKAELIYYKRIFLYIFIISLVGFINLHNAPIMVKNYPSKESMGYVFLAHMLIYFMGGLFTVFLMKEKKIRHHIQLPLSIQNIWLLRFITYLIYWLSIVLLFSIFNWIYDYLLFNKYTILYLCSQTAIAIILISIIFLWKDISVSLGNRKSLLHIPLKKLVGFIGFLMIFILVFTAIWLLKQSYEVQGDFNKFHNFLSWIFLSEFSTIFFTVLGLGLVVLEMFTFKNRKSFVE